MFILSILLVWFNLKKFITIDFIGILLRLFQSLGAMNKNLHAVSAFHVYLEKLYEIEQNKEMIHPENFLLESNLDNKIAIKLENVSFKYLGSEQYLFENLDLVFYRNKHTLITGFNGSGKSTLLGLSTGIFYPDKGKVKTFSDKIGYVSANPMILNSTLRENLTYGNNGDEKSDNLMMKYLKDFKVFEDTEAIELSKKINNKSLSMGQMQKISFIRALLSGLDILILDESTSNLDTDSKEIIYNILKKESVTIINSTHNPEDFIDFDYHITIDETQNGRKISTK